MASNSAGLSPTPPLLLLKQEPQDNHQFLQQQLQHRFANSLTHLRSLSSALSTFHRRYDELHHHLDYISSSIDSQLLPQSPKSPQITLPSPQINSSSDPVAHNNNAPAKSPEITLPSPQKTQSSSDPATHNNNEPAKSPEITLPFPQKTLSSSEPPTHNNNESAKSPEIIVPSPQKTLSSSDPPTHNNNESAKSPEITVPSPQKNLSDNNNDSAESGIEYLCKRMEGRLLRRYIIAHLSNIPKLREQVPGALKLAPRPGRLVLECFGRFFLQGIKAYNKDSPMIRGRQASVLILEFFLLMGGFKCDEIEAEVREEAGVAAGEWRKRLISEGGLEKACEVDARGLLLFIGCFGIPSVFKNNDFKDLIRASNARELSDVLRRSDVLVTRITEIIEGLMKKKSEVEAVNFACTFGLDSRFPPQTILTSFLQESKETWKKAEKTSPGPYASLRANKAYLADLKCVMKCLEDHNIDPLKVLPGWELKKEVSTIEGDIIDLAKKTREQAPPKRKVDEPESSKNLKSQEVKRTRFTGRGPEHPNLAAYVDGKGSFDNSRPMTLLDGSFPGHITSFSASSSVLHGAGGAGVGAAMPATTGDVLPAGSYAGVYGGVLVDRAGQVINHGQPYGWRGDPYAEAAARGVNSMYRPAQSVDGFVGLPNSSSIGVASRSTASDLYQFADSIPDSGVYTSSRTGGTAPNVTSARYPSYLY